jgi:hypothetical protein
MSMATAHSPISTGTPSVRADRTRAARISVGALLPSFSALVPKPAAHGAPVSVGPRPRDGTAASKGRVCLIDNARGLFLFWMVVAHALGLAGVTRRPSPFSSRPPRRGSASASWS